MSICVFSGEMQQVLEQVRRLHANRAIPVLIEGETGTGKDAVARYIHCGDEHIDEPFIELSCALIAPESTEADLFGYAPGACGGALPRGKKGKIDLAQGGTLFLDHVEALSPAVQPKLLRMIEDKAFYRVGGLKKVKADFRIICASSVDLAGQVERGSFRPDLYYRLSVARIYLPPLRERREEIIPLARMFLARFAREKGKRFAGISRRAADLLRSYYWPGNIRELRNTIELIVALWDDEEVTPAHLAMLPKARMLSETPGFSGTNVINPGDFSLPLGSLPLEEYNNRIILKALEMHGGNKTKTAKYLGISRRSLDCRLKRIKSAVFP
ncbi:MAG: sigma 54-interacting transcriptional regulator [Bacillota bacterium]